MKKTLITIASFIILLAPQFAHADITTGLIGYYKFEGNGNDSAGTVGNLTLNNATYTTGKIDSQALVLTAASPTWGDTSAQTWPQTGFTFSAWVNIVSASDANPEVIAARWEGTGNPYLQIYYINGAVTGRIMQDGSNYIGRDTPSLLTAGVWHLVTMTWNGGTTNSSIKVYIDGVQSDTINDGGGTFTGPSTDSAVLHIGVLDVFHEFPMNGNMDDARIYNRGLSSSDVTQLYFYPNPVPSTIIPTTVSLGNKIIVMLGSVFKINLFN